MILIGQTEPLLPADFAVTKDAFEQRHSEEIKTRLGWDTRKFSLRKATIEIKASQGATSGADLTVSLNGVQIAIIRWHGLETGQKVYRTPDIASKMVNGDNVLSLSYAAPNHHLQQSICTVSALASLGFEPLTGAYDQTPADTGSFKDQTVGSDFVKWLKDNIRLVLIVGTVTVVVVVAAFLYLGRLKVPGMGKISTFLRRGSG